MENELPKRKNIRIPKYNYSKPGYYFITICTQGRKKMLSKVIYNDNNVGGRRPVTQTDKKSIEKQCRGGPCVRPYHKK